MVLQVLMEKDWMCTKIAALLTDSKTCYQASCLASIKHIMYMHTSRTTPTTDCLRSHTYLLLQQTLNVSDIQLQSSIGSGHCLRKR